MGAFGMDTTAQEEIGLQKSIETIGLRRLPGIESAIKLTALCSVPKVGEST